MAITYPRQLPNNARMQEAWFELQDNVASAFSGKNKINLSQVNDPAWTGKFVTGILSRESEPVWSSWRISLRGMRQFIAYDVRRSAPGAYPSAKAPADVQSGWNGLATVSSLGLSGALGLASLPANYQFKAGDRIGLEQSGFYGYYDVLEDVTASGGGAVTVNVAPFLHTSVFTTSAVARIWRPFCKFVLTDWSAAGDVAPSAVQFNGIQRL